MFQIKDYRNEKPYQVYYDAMDFGVEQAKHYNATKHGGNPIVESPIYWASWYAARRTAIALLAEAKDMGLSDEQWERLRKIAALVATD